MEGMDADAGRSEYSEVRRCGLLMRFLYLVKDEDVYWLVLVAWGRDRRFEERGYGEDK